jgi:flagellar biosynthesis/type III secretory pathway chaperone
MTREQNLDSIYQLLQKHLGLHRQLMDVVRAEKEALVQADLKKLQEITLAKEGLIESVRVCELDRMKVIGALAIQLKKPLRELTLSGLIIAVQGFDLKRAEQLRSVYQALQVLIQRITEQNNYNRSIVEKSLGNVDAMKKNVLGESVPKAGTYNVHGQKTHGGGSSRLISKEA